MSAGADSGTEERVKSLIAKAFDEGLSAAAKEFLIQNYPDLGAQIPDLDNIASSSTAVTSLDHRDVVGVNSASKIARTGEKCTTYTGWNTYHSLLGTPLYRFKQSARLCSNGSRVTSHDKPRYSVYERAWTIDDIEVRQLWVDGVGRWESKSFLELRVTHCIVNYGCYGASAPTGEIIAYGNNTASINTYFS